MSKNQPHTILAYLPLAAAAVVIAFVLASFKIADRLPTNTDVREEGLQIQTLDGISLAADIHWPEASEPIGTVILIHDFATDRHQWDAYAERFAAAGLAVVQYDMRGFGDSRLPRISGDRTTYLNSLVDDVPAIMEYIRSQPRLTNEPITVVGVGLGANIAYVASGSGLGVAQTVIISSSAANGLPDGAAVDQFTPSDVLGLTNPAGEADMVAFMSRVAEPKQVTTITHAQGLAILDDPATMDEVLAWLTSR